MTEDAQKEQLMIGLDYATASSDVLEVLVDDADPEVLSEIAKANSKRPEVLRMVLENPDTPEEVRSYINGVMTLPAPVSSAIEENRKAKTRERQSEAGMESRKESLTARIQKLTVSARVQLALKGGREIRGILARDSNKEVMLSVLENGKITVSEIELMAKSRSVLEEALRRITKNREWMKNYAVLLAVITNPKTPPGLSIQFLSDLKTKDLIILEKNRNLAEAVRSASKKLLKVRKPS